MRSSHRSHSVPCALLRSRSRRARSALADAQGARFALRRSGRVRRGAVRRAAPRMGRLARQVFREGSSTTRRTSSCSPRSRRAGEERATAEASGRRSPAQQAMTPADQLVVILIGHGSGQGTTRSSISSGPISAWRSGPALSRPCRAGSRWSNTASASFPSLGPRRTRPRRHHRDEHAVAAFHTVFPEGFVQALSSDAADLDKNSRISLLEAFTYAARLVDPALRAGRDDGHRNGGDRRRRRWQAQDGTRDRARREHRGADAISTRAWSLRQPIPRCRSCSTRQQGLTEQVDDLRRRQSSMPADEYESELEKLLTELAIVSRDIRQRSAK